MASAATPGDRPAPTSNELALARTNLAVRRSMMAADRTLMAWVRTGLSMISFGFTIYKLLEGFRASGAEAAMNHSPRNIGLFLTGLGTICVVMGTLEFWTRLREARAHGHFGAFRPSFVMALIMSAAGLFLFIGIISRLL